MRIDFVWLSKSKHKSEQLQLYLFLTNWLLDSVTCMVCYISWYNLPLLVYRVGKPF